MTETERVLEAALEMLRKRQAAAIVTVIEARGSTPRGVAARMVVAADATTVGTVGGGAVEARAIEEALAAIAEGCPREVSYSLVDEERGDPGVCGGEMRLFIDVLQPRPTLLIVGGGHVGQAVAEMGAFLGFHVTVMDDRREVVEEKRFPWAEERLAGDPAELLRDYPLTPTTYVVLVTPHYSLDERLLPVLDGRPLPYVGLIGSRRRTALTFKKARERGVSEEFLRRVHTPIGLDIGAETPQELAVSIIAEVIAVQRKGASGE